MQAGAAPAESPTLTRDCSQCGQHAARELAQVLQFNTTVPPSQESPS